MESKNRPGNMVESSLGRKCLDNQGAAVGASRMDPAEAYGAGPLLLQEYINTGSLKAWEEMRRRIDNVYAAVGRAMESLESAEPFADEVKNLLNSGKKLFFKPNLVSLPSVDPVDHSPVLIGTCLPWEFLAALMRWFHDKLDVSYHSMAVGEAGTTMPTAAFHAAKAFGLEKVTTQAVIEGKCGEHYGGWGFYFVRKYLAESHQYGHRDDPMLGYEESLSGVCVPPGEVKDRLLVYDLNKIAPDMSDGREVPVPGGANFKSIVIHKAVIGGDPLDENDKRRWPAPVLVNVARLKIHVMELFTAAIKNLGIGLYPMEYNTSREPGKYCWKYGLPDLRIPFFKMKIPHARWVVEYDEEKLTPILGPDGNYIWRQTGGMEANMADIIQAVKTQGVKMLHVVDAIEADNIAHAGPGATPVPEGFVFAGHDIVALDACGGRYLFTMLPLQETEKVCRDLHLSSDAVRPVPMPEIRGMNIQNGEGYDSPFSRYSALKPLEDRGLGRRQYYVIGDDLRQGGRLASLQQHLGRVQDGIFTELFTKNLYYTPNKALWDFQATCLRYLELEDKLTGSDYKRQVMEAFDENGDGVIDYLEIGRGDSQFLISYLTGLTTQDLDPLAALEIRFLLTITQLKRLKKGWNRESHYLGEQTLWGQAMALAFAMSRAGEEKPDPCMPGRMWGKGKWPSMKLVLRRQMGIRIFGQRFPERFDSQVSPYACAFRYADSVCGEGQYCRDTDPSEDVIGKYHQAVTRGAECLLFTFYVPAGLGLNDESLIPNVKETDDPELMFTAVFITASGPKAWRELKLAKYDLK